MATAVGSPELARSRYERIKFPRGDHALLRARILSMKTNITKMGAALLAVGICVCCAELRAQTTTRV